MGPLGWWLVASIVVLILAVAVMVLAGAMAVMHYPDELDPDRNSKRFVAPAMVAFVVAVLATLSLILAVVFIIAEAVTAT